jgi:hypothetical protein
VSNSSYHGTAFLLYLKRAKSSPWLQNKWDAGSYFDTIAIKQVLSLEETGRGGNRKAKGM